MDGSLKNILKNAFVKLRHNQDMSVNKFMQKDANSKIVALKADGQSCKTCNSCGKKALFDYCKLKKKVIKLYNVCDLHTLKQ